MARWEPDARGRLAEAAMKLYQERGYDQTTVAEIAERAGLTERTFFRYFADKREVFFAGSATLQTLIVDGILGAPEGMAPLDTVVLALEGTAPFFDERRPFAQKRHALILAHAELHEREVMKLSALAASAAQALRRRGVDEPSASLSAEAGISVFKIGFEQWIADPKKKGLVHHLRQSLRALQAAVAGPKKISAGRR